MKIFNRLCILTLLVTASVLSPISVNGQSKKAQAQKVMSDFNYVYGEGWGETVEEADQQALANLTSKIATSISSQFNMNETEMVRNDGVKSISVANSVINTYSQATLTNTEELVVEPAPKAYVVRYIKTSEVNKIFSLRKDKVFDYLRSAAKSEQNGKIGNALRYYYWSLIMLKSLQYPNEVTFEDDEGKHLLMSWIPMRLDEILENIDTKIASRKGSTVKLYITYNGKPVESIDFSYFDGLQWSPQHSARNGVASIELRKNASIKNLQLNYEYQYADETQIDKETQEVLALFKDVKFPKANKIIGQDARKETADFKTDALKDVENALRSDAQMNIGKCEDDKQYAKVMEQVVEAIKTANYDNVRGSFTDNGWDMFERLLKYGKARLLGEAYYSFYTMGDEVVCRSIPMSFSFNNNKRKFIEAVTFTFNSEKKIDALAFALDPKAKSDIFDRNLTSWSDDIKMTIASFLENYKTAFALKRLDYIESIFDDEAVIIVGRIVKKGKKTMENEKYISNNNVVYNRVSKRDYIENLQSCFNSNEFINIRFTDNEVLKSQTGGELYGIQIHQDYYSSKYGDTGYLFLLVDINNPKQPTILVRTWQPDRDPNVNSKLDKDDPYYGIYTMGNF